MIMTEARRFPVQSREGLPKSVPWFLVGPHEAQAKANHGQPLEMLANRGGLNPGELWCVVHDQPYRSVPSEHYCDAWLSGINDLRVATVRAEGGQE